ncbi:unnamed protein product [Adineta steineri]|uniref:Uncharacterized protein n=1 Tax=Adineta steineri TaxID=433720 RepID=A0A815CH14_9BILA|nr:unnamed protein product [Adineta steineri]
MSSHQGSISIIITTDQSSIKHRLSYIFKYFIQIFTHHGTPKVVRFESRWIASLSLFVKLTFAIGCIYLMCKQGSYQIFDRSPISAVTIKVKPLLNCSITPPITPYFRNYNCNQASYDVNDFIVPPTENSAVTISTRVIEIEHVLKCCEKNITKRRRNGLLMKTTVFHECIDNTTVGIKRKKRSRIAETSHQCNDEPRCILPPYYRLTDANGTINERPQLCWFKSPPIAEKRNYQALHYVLFIKNYVEFPIVKLVHSNLADDIFTEDYLKICEYDPHTDPLCPKFRISTILQLIEKNTAEYDRMFTNGSLIEIKISWICDLDKNKKHCKPNYEFQRLDHTNDTVHPYQPGSTFLTSKHFFRPDAKQLTRIHKHIYNLHIIVTVTGEVGIFDLFQTTTSIGSFIGMISAATLVCDLIAAFFTNFRSVKYDN